VGPTPPAASSNYASAEYDRLFTQMKTLANGPERQVLIDQMVAVAQQDAPWAMGYFPYVSAAHQRWVKNYKPAILIRDHGRYLRLDVADRMAAQAEWNRPVWWPLFAIGAALLGLVLLARMQFRRRERTNARGEVLA